MVKPKKEEEPKKGILRRYGQPHEVAAQAVQGASRSAQRMSVAYTLRVTKEGEATIELDLPVIVAAEAIRVCLLENRSLRIVEPAPTDQTILRKKKVSGARNQKIAVRGERTDRVVIEDAGEDEDTAQATDIADELSRETFDKVRDLFVLEGSSHAVATELDLPIEEVNRAVKFKQYAAYVRNRMSE